MKIIKRPLTNGQYLTQKFEKTSLFLHHTIGLTAMGAWRWWNQTPERVGTPYILDRDGSVIECFDPEVWAFHLGIKGDDNYHEKHCVSLEIVSAGPLHKVKGKEEFRFYPLWPDQSRYTIIPEEEVITFKKPFRGNKYYHAYSEAQLKALPELLMHIHEKFPKINMFNKVDNMFTYDESIISGHKSGMFTHCSVRKDKSDIIPYPAVLDTLKDFQASIKPASEKKSLKKD